MNIIKGHYADESGLLEFGELYVEKTPNGFIHAETGSELIAAEYEITNLSNGIEITSKTMTIRFLPDSGECNRVGMPIIKLSQQK